MSSASSNSIRMGINQLGLIKSLSTEFKNYHKLQVDILSEHNLSYSNLMNGYEPGALLLLYGIYLTTKKIMENNGLGTHILEISENRIKELRTLGLPI